MIIISLDATQEDDLTREYVFYQWWLNSNSLVALWYLRVCVCGGGGGMGQDE